MSRSDHRGDADLIRHAIRRSIIGGLGQLRAFEALRRLEATSDMPAQKKRTRTIAARIARAADSGFEFACVGCGCGLRDDKGDHYEDCDLVDGEAREHASSSAAVRPGNQTAGGAVSRDGNGT